MSSYSATSTATNVPGPWQVLLVTDSLIDWKLLAGLLVKHRHRVFAAGNGSEALSEWTKNKFDVVILDALLSEMDGAELVRGIRQLETAPSRVPIVVLSENESDRDRCRQAGADVCLARPFQISEFHACVQAARNPGTAKRPEGVADSDSIDWQVALDAVGGRRDLLAELVDIFCIEYPTTLTAIRTAIDNRDTKALQMSAHQLKGCLRYFGKTAASELASTLEDIGRSGQIDGAAGKIEPLIAAIQRLLPQFRHGPD